MRGEAYSGSAAARGWVAGPDLLLPQYLFGPVRVAAQWVLSVICLEWCCHLGKWGEWRAESEAANNAGTASWRQATAEGWGGGAQGWETPQGGASQPLCLRWVSYWCAKQRQVSPWVASFILLVACMRNLIFYKCGDCTIRAPETSSPQGAIYFRTKIWRNFWLSWLGDRKHYCRLVGRGLGCC